MHVFLFSGIAVSLLINELTGFSPGGIIVAGYLSMYVMHPKWIIGTILAAFLTYCLVELFKRHTLLYGRRLFSIYVLTGIFVAELASWFFMLKSVTESILLVIGYLIPGLIAKDFARQGVVLTILWLMIAVLLTRLVILAGEGLIW